MIQALLIPQSFELVFIDFPNLDRCKRGYEYILGVINHFTSKSGKTAANIIFNYFALKFGFPSCIHYDQGGEFKESYVQPAKGTVWGGRV